MLHGNECCLYAHSMNVVTSLRGLTARQKVMCVKTKKKKDEGWQVETSPQTVGAAVWDSIFYLAKPKQKCKTHFMI